MDAEVQRLLESRTREELIDAAVVGAGVLARADGVRAARITVDDPVTYRVVAQHSAGADPSPAVAVDPLGHPLIRHYVTTRTRDWVSIEDILPGRQWLEHPLYRDVYRPVGLRSQISCELVATSGSVMTMSLNRAGKDFGPAERRALIRYRILVRAAWGRATELDETRAALAAFDRLAAEDRSLVLVLAGEHRELLHASDAFLELLASDPDLMEAIRYATAGAPRHELVAALDATHALALSWTNLGDMTVIRARAQDRLGLTDRETQILQALSSGDTSRAIASRLGVGLSTVNKHLEHAYTKLGAHDRVTAVTVARDHGVIP